MYDDLPKFYKNAYSQMPFLIITNIILFTNMILLCKKFKKAKKLPNKRKMKECG